jgi:integrase
LKPLSGSPATPTAGPRNFMTAAARRFCSKIWRGFGIETTGIMGAEKLCLNGFRKAGIITKLGCHTFRATGITVYLLNGGLLEYAQQMAAHESAGTTKLYDRRNDQATLDQVERIVL